MDMAEESTGISAVSIVRDMRTDQLNILWIVTLVGAGIIAWLSLLLVGEDMSQLGSILKPTLVLVIGSLATRGLLKRDLYQLSAWAFLLSHVLSVALFMASPIEVVADTAPFMFPMLISLAGLILTPVASVILFAISVLAIVATPWLLQGELLITPLRMGAITLSLVGTVLAVLTAGELYSVAAWSLVGYTKARERAEELRQSREALKRSLKVQEELNRRLRETNEELKIARAAADEANRLKGQFLANMSHELRTPLNVIMGFSETILNYPEMYDGVRLPEPYYQDMQQIFNSGQHLLHLINDILDLSRVEAGKLDLRLEEVDLKPIFEGTMSILIGLTKDKPIELIKDWPDDLPTVYADAVRIRQVIINLFSNAAKFTQEGHIALRARYDDKHVVVSVEDTGIGIAPEHHEAIFEEFRQVARYTGGQRNVGSGLGLTISKRLIDLQEGRIWVESELGKGATFHFELWRYDAWVAEHPEPQEHDKLRQVAPEHQREQT